MTKFTHMKGLFGLLPTPYRDDLEIHTEDLKRVARFCCETGQHGIVWPVMVGEFYALGEEEQAGLREFYRRAFALGLVPRVPELRFHGDP